VTAAAQTDLARKLARTRRRFGRLLERPRIRRFRRIMHVYDRAGGSLLAEGLAYSALFAGLTGLLFSVGLLGYFVPAEADRQRIVDAFTGELAPFAPIARGGLSTLAANAGAFSLVGLAGLAWGASHFYASLDIAISRIFTRSPARNWFDRVVRGFVSVLLLFGGLMSSVAISVVQEILNTTLPLDAAGDLTRSVDAFVFPLATATVVVIAVAIVYRVVPNTAVPFRALWAPALVAGIALALLAKLLVYITPLLTGSLSSVFGGVAAVFAALAWLHLAFQVLLLGAAWTRVRVEDLRYRRRALEAATA
jgi:membrane protein